MKLKFAPVIAAVLLASCNNAAENAVRSEMIDGDSAKFEDVQRCTGDSAITVGKVNGKNRMGAYTGFEPFFVENGVAYFASSPQFSDVMGRCYSDLTDPSTDAMEKGATPASTTSAQPKPTSNWVNNEKRDAIDDSAVISASLVADSGTSSNGDPITFIARCGSNKTDVYAIWNDYVGDDSDSVYSDWKRVEVRVGSSPAETQLWDTSTDSQATFAPSPVELLKRMAKSDRLVLRMTPYNENPVTAVFKLDGIKDALRPIAKECGWQL